MITLKKILYLIYICCVLQWFVAHVDSVATSTSNQVSLAATNDGQTKDASVFGSSKGILDTLAYKSRQSRCVTCYEERRYDDRNRYSGSHPGRTGDDRSANWYYPRYDRYSEDRYRGGEGDYDRYGSGDRYGDRYGMDRYGYRDDRYDSRTSYDRYDTKGLNRYNEKRGYYDRGESRGYGYDNRDRYYGGERGGDYGRDRYYDRPRYGTGGASGYGYDRDYYDRYSPRYESRHYRQWDDTYRGHDAGAGRGHYYVKGVQEDRRYLPEPSYKGSGGSPCGILKPNCHYGPQEGGAHVSSGTIDSGSHNMGVSHSIYNAHSNQNDSNKGPSPGWSYMREDDSEHQPPRVGIASGNNGSGSGSSSSSNNRDRTRDQQSPAYGALLDRGSNLIAVEPIKSADNANENNEKPSSSADDTKANANQSVSGQTT